MIRPLRQRHRRVFVVLGIFLPVAFAFGIAARKPVQGMASLPKEFFASSHSFAAAEWDRADLFTKTPIRVQLLRESAGTGRFAVEFSVAKDFVKPDLIVYWVAGSRSITETLPDDARLLGAFNSSVALPLPADIVAGSGVLVLYSLADQEIVEVSKPITLQKP